MGELVKFDFGGASVTTIKDERGDVWWVAMDVCNILGYANSRKAVSDHCKYPKLLKSNESLLLGFGPRGVTLIPESDLYRLIIKSTLPAAEQFEKWVMEDVLPKIRKTGYYGKDPMELLKDPVAMRTMLLTYSEKIIELQPKADGFDRIADAEGSLNVSETAKALQVAVMWLFKFLSLNRWIFRRPGGAYWLGYSDKVQQGLLTHKATTVTRPDGTEKVAEQVRVTPKGLAKLALIMNGGENV